jgi:RHS repeat-associated protein
LNELYYEAYGKVTDKDGMPINLTSSTVSTPLSPLFVGAFGIRYDRKTELSYMRFRWYSLSNLRFISADKIGSINRYSYANGNPLIFIDPLGLWYVYYSNGHIYAVPTNWGDTPSDLTNAGYLKPKKFNKTTWDITEDLQRVYGKEMVPKIFEYYYNKQYRDSNYSERADLDSLNCGTLALGALNYGNFGKYFKDINSSGCVLDLEEKYEVVGWNSYYYDPKDKNIAHHERDGAGKILLTVYDLLENTSNFTSFAYNHHGHQQLILGDLFFSYSDVAIHNGAVDFHLGLPLGLRQNGEALMLQKPGFKDPLIIGTIEDLRHEYAHRTIIRKKKCRK